MSDTRMKDLFELARDDGPSEASRDAMWAGIQTTTLGASVNVGVAAAKGAGLASSKLALGIALGASMTVGIAATVLALARTPDQASHVISATPRELDREEGAELRVDRRVEAVRPPIVVTGHIGGDNTVELKDVPQAQTQGRTGTTTLSEHDRLAREARMVSEARGALHRGDADTALRIVRAARATQGARLVPEELTVEAQALRALGDEAGAKRAEADLAGKFPETAIQR